MARVLIVGDSDRVLLLTDALKGAGHLVRVVGFASARRDAVEAAGADYVGGDPARLGTITAALTNVSIACWMPAGSRGEGGEEVRIDGERLRAFLEKTIDSTVRGLVYEIPDGEDQAFRAAPEGGQGDGGERSAGGLGGLAIAREIAGLNSIPLRVLSVEATDAERWCAQALAEIERLIRTP